MSFSIMTFFPRGGSFSCRHVFRFTGSEVMYEIIYIYNNNYISINYKVIYIYSIDIMIRVYIYIYDFVRYFRIQDSATVSI